jgi:hypothetical protein
MEVVYPELPERVVVSQQQPPSKPLTDNAHSNDR